MQQGRMDSFVFCTKCKVLDNGTPTFASLAEGLAHKTPLE